MNASIRNELEVLEGWLLSTVIWQKIIKFLGHKNRNDSFGKGSTGRTSNWEKIMR